MLLLSLLLFSKSNVRATPSVAFPINAQVPPVGRVSQPFEFQFALATFSSALTNVSYLQYSLTSDAPSWLELNSATRTFSGTPDYSNLGSSEFGLTVTDETGSIEAQVTFVVVDSSTPHATTNMTAELAQFGTLSGPNTISLETSTEFDITFLSSIFTTMSNPVYYATSSDRSPLPSWIDFDSETLSFSGLSPPLLSNSQTFGITLFVTRVTGFEEASIEFNIEVSNHKLVFQNVEQTINVSSKEFIYFRVQESELLLDGQPVSQNEITNISAQLPSWLHFDSQNMSIYGQAPVGTTYQQVTVTANDVYGDSATLLVDFYFAYSLFIKQIGTLNATMGMPFTYTISRSIFSDTNVSVTVTYDEALSWLYFDANTLTLHGNVPSHLNFTVLNASITASLTNSSVIETQVFSIRVQTISTTSAVESRVMPTASTATASTNPTASLVTVSVDREGLSTGDRAGIGLGCAVVALIFIGATIWCIRTRRGEIPWISNPIIMGKSFRRMQRRYHKNPVEKAPHENDVERSFFNERAPQLHNEILGFGNFTGTSNHRYENSTGTILLPADEEMLRGMNRTSFGTDALEIHAPHDAMKLPAQMARGGSQSSLPLPQRRYFRESVLSLGHRRSKLSQVRLSFKTPARDRRNERRKSGDRSSLLSQTSYYSDTRHSNVLVGPWRSKTREDVAQTNAERAWIRCVSPTSEPLNEIDHRPLADRRQSFVRNRASNAHGNPLFASHGFSSRLTSPTSRIPLGHRSSNNSRGLTARAPFTRSKSSSLGVGTGMQLHSRMSKGASFKSADEWQDASSNYSGEESDYNLEGHLREETSNHLQSFEDMIDEEVERESKRNKWSNRLGRDGRGEVMDSIIEGDAIISMARRGRLTQDLRSYSWRTRTELMSNNTDEGSSFRGNDAFL